MAMCLFANFFLFKHSLNLLIKPHTHINLYVHESVKIDILYQLLRMIKFPTIIVNLCFYTFKILKLALNILKFYY